MIAGDKEEGCFPFFAVAKLAHAPAGLNKPFIYPLATLFGAVHTHFPFPLAHPHRSFIELGFLFENGDMEINSFWCLTEARIISSMYVIIT
jgi:hypothetical protein